MFNVGDEAKEVLTLFQLSVSPIFFMVGLLMLMVALFVCNESVRVRISNNPVQFGLKD